MTQSTNTTPIPAEVAAWKKLTESQVDKLWEEKVTNASWLMTLTGLRYVDYAWNKSAAAEKDVTVNLFKEKLANYIHALDKRGLNDTETTAPRVYNNDAQRDLDTEFAKTAKTAEKAFFKEFKTLANKLGIDISSEAGVDTTKGVLVGMKEFADKVKTERKNNLFTKVESSFKTTFSKRVFKDAVETFSTQPIESLTPENVEAKAKSLKKIFPKNELVAIENALRTSIASGNNGANKAALAALSTAYLALPVAPAVDNAKVTALEGTMRVDLTATELALRTRIEELCGANMGAARDGAINTAYNKMIEAETAKNNAFTAFQTARGTAPDATAQDAWVGINVVDALASQDVKDKHAAFLTAHEAHKAFKVAHDALMTELGTLAVWTHGNISSGKYREVEVKLGDVNRVARDRANELGQFFAHLSSDV